jgi:hypothetical protein
MSNGSIIYVAWQYGQRADKHASEQKKKDQILPPILSKQN